MKTIYMKLFLIGAIIFSMHIFAKGSDQREVASQLKSAVQAVGDTNSALNCENSIGVSCTEAEKRALDSLCNPDVNRCAVKADTSQKIIVSDELVSTFRRMGGDPVALQQALCFLNKNKDKRFRAKGTAGYPMGMGITNQRYITINHLTKSSKELRLFVIDLEEGKIKAYKSAHGRGTEERKNGTFSKYTSNEKDTWLSPRGFFLTGRKYIPQDQSGWDRAMRLHGLQAGVNDKSYERGIVMHPVKYVIPNKLTDSELGSKSLDNLSKRQKKRLLGWGYDQYSGKTQGCTGLGGNSIFEEIYAKIGAGDVRGMTQKYTDEDGNTIRAFPDNHSLYYNYSTVEKKKGPSYCGDDPKEPLMLTEK